MSPRRSVLRALLSTPGPAVAVEVAADHVAAVQLGWSKHGPVLAAHARTELPDGALTPGVNALNIVDRTAVTDALRSVFGQLPRRPSRVALIVPDSVAKVSLVRFEKVPARAGDLDQLIRWQVRKAAPFRLEDAQVSYTPGAGTDGGQEFIVALMRRDVAEEYEHVCAAAGAHAGLIDLASFNLINAALAGAVPDAGADWLLVHVATGYSTLAIVRGRDLIFFRNRPAGGDANLADLVHQTAMYYQDRLGGSGFARALLAGEAHLGGVDGGGDAVRRTLADRLTATVESIGASVIAPVTDRTGADAALLDTLAAPIGLLLRDRGGQA